MKVKGSKTHQLNYPLYLYNIHAFDHTSEHGVLVIQPRRGHCCNEKLRAVRVRTSVCHRESEWPIMAKAARSSTRRTVC